MKTAILIILTFISLNAFSQMDSYICSDANPNLLKLIKYNTIKNIEIDGFGEGSLASSYLKSEGKIPKNTDVEVWKCRYSPANLSDNNTKTAWVEGVKGYGIGEFVIVPNLDLKKPIKIWNGYGKSQKTYLANSRVKKIKLYIISAEIQDFSQNGLIYKNIKIVAKKNIDIKDVNKYQTLNIPQFKIEKYFSKMQGSEVEYKYLLGIEIIEVYKGTKWDDTCISELKNF